jgi:hypothetical protein
MRSWTGGGARFQANETFVGFVSETAEFCGFSLLDENFVIRRNVAWVVPAGSFRSFTTSLRIGNATNLGME